MFLFYNKILYITSDFSRAEMLWLGVAFGFVLGLIAIWILLHFVYKTDYLKRLREVENENTITSERLRMREEVIEKMDRELDEVRLAKDESLKREFELRAKLKETDEKFQHQKEILDNAQEKLTDAFENLSNKVFSANQKSFLRLAEENLSKQKAETIGQFEKKQEAINHLVKPINETLKKFEENVREIEKERGGAYSAITEQLKSMELAQKTLRDEASQLVKALRQPNVRGRWGEIQLRRVVEFAGMIEHCDFIEQGKGESEAGNLKPDLIVRMPGDRSVIVDAKTPISAYIDAAETSDESKREELLQKHSQQLRKQIDLLAKKNYWDSVKSTPEFVVLFLPGEAFFSNALLRDADILEYAMKKKILLASPVTLIALLRSVAYGWRQESLVTNARKISDLGAEIFYRLNTMSKHFNKLGSSLRSSVENFNRAMRNLETRVFVTARKFQDYKAVSDNEKLKIDDKIDQIPMTAPETGLEVEKENHDESNGKKLLLESDKKFTQNYEKEKGVTATNKQAVDFDIEPKVEKENPISKESEYAEGKFQQELEKKFPKKSEYAEGGTGNLRVDEKLKKSFSQDLSPRPNILKPDLNISSDNNSSDTNKTNVVDTEKTNVKEVETHYEEGKQANKSFESNAFKNKFKQIDIERHTKFGKANSSDGSKKTLEKKYSSQNDNNDGSVDKGSYNQAKDLNKTQPIKILSEVSEQNETSSSNEKNNSPQNLKKSIGDSRDFNIDLDDDLSEQEDVEIIYEESNSSSGN